MLESEWLEFGYKNGIIKNDNEKCLHFVDAFRFWFVYKMKSIKNTSLDRIECTYNRYIKDTEFETKQISEFNEKVLLDFFLDSIYQKDIKSHKEFSRLYQVIRSPLLFVRDSGQGYVKSIDWESIKRMLPHDVLKQKKKIEYATSTADVAYLIDSVVNKKIYTLKQSACLCLCMNFFLGLRIGELAGLRFKDFDFVNNVLRVSHSEVKFYNRDENGERVGSMHYEVVDSLKTENSFRFIPLIPEVKYFYNEIEKHHANMGYESEFLAYDGSQTVLTRSLERTLTRLCELCETSHINSHKIRKTFATTLHYNNVPTKIISGLLGHSEIATTEKCYILNFEDKFGEISKLMQNGLKYGKMLDKKYEIVVNRI